VRLHIDVTDARQERVPLLTSSFGVVSCQLRTVGPETNFRTINAVVVMVTPVDLFAYSATNQKLYIIQSRITGEGAWWGH